ncbi:MAG: alpha-glucosidase [Bacilli bacterium]|nr:alpha-glucosidase [Bacilli bacterium]
MDKIELSKYFFDQLINGECYLVVAKCNAKYKMSRGSFKKHISKRDINVLKYTHKDGNRYVYSNGKVSAEIITEDQRAPFKFHFHVDFGFNYFEIRFKTFEGEHFYGFGEQYTTLDLSGKTVPIWVSEHQQVLEIAKKLLRWKIKGKPEPDRVASYKHHQTYCSVPTFISSKNYAFYCHGDSYGEVKLKNGEVIISFTDTPKSISLLTADNMEELASELCKLVGIPAPIPDWVNDGAILAVQGGLEEIKKKYLKAKEKGVKIAALWAQDWCGHVVTSFGYQVYWNWAKDDELYPGLEEFIKELNKDGVRFLGYINTFLKKDAPLYNFAKINHFLVKKQNGEVYHIKSTTFDAGIVDLTNPSAYEWYKNIIKENMIGIGLSGFMADFGEYLPTDALVYGGDAKLLHNKWPSLWAKCCAEAIKESGKENEVFFFSRAAYGHTLKYTNSMWNGDQHVDFSDEYGIGSVIPASLSLSCSGCGVVHSDIGGYTTVMMMKRGKELFDRWAEMNVFTPVYRTHEGNRPKDNVQFSDDEVIDNFALNSTRFATLKPYRKAVLDEYYKNGTPAIRPLFFEYTSKEEYFTNKREYLFGSDILVAPVLREKVNKHNVLLPEGNWVQFFTGDEYQGGEITVDSPIGQPIAFYKKDSKFKDLFESMNTKKGE